MHSASHNDVRPFLDVHNGPGCKVVVIATSQVHFICMGCGFSITQDAINAGAPVMFDEDPSDVVVPK